MQKFLWAILALLSFQTTSAQFNFEAVFPGQIGSQLESSVRDAYKPSTVLNYSVARDSMFRNVYGINNTLSCVYTGHTLPMPLGQDPTEAVYLNGAANGINTEHSWPRSYGAENGNPKSDMHHLFPTRLDVNSDRGTLPFLDVIDSQTIEWYFMSIQQGNVPGSNIDLYSERGGAAFEPREDHKGNVARAMMYFKTIYKLEAQQAPVGFWETMAPVLCNWHGQDPIDSLEWHRTWIIASYQNNKPNPFVLDCTLAERLFCPGFSGTCDPTVPVINVPEFTRLQLFPNPAVDQLQIDLSAFQSGETRQLTLYNSLGVALQKEIITGSAQVHNLQLSPAFTAGWYVVQIRSGKKIGTARFIIQ